jgi:hypothetical protein
MPAPRLTKRALLGAAIAGVLAAAAHGAAADDVLTQRYNNERTGSHRQPGLNQAAVQEKSWGLLGTLAVQGTVYAQPLYVENLLLPNNPGPRNVVYVATALNTIYAFDATTLARLWPAGPQGLTLGPNDKTTIGSVGCDGISSPEGIGLEATPVIDHAKGVIYVSYRTNRSATDRTKAEQRLAAVDIRTGAKLSDIKVAPASAPADWVVWHRSRAGLLLLDGILYVAFASRCEDPGQPIFHGWILAYDAATMKRVGNFTTTPESARGKTVDGGGIWQGAVGLAADADGFIYATTGNRRLAPVVDSSPADTPNLADSFIRLKPTISRLPAGPVQKVDLAVVDWFTPYRKIWLDDTDLDLAAAGPVVIPGTRYLVGGGKSGIVYVLDRANMGKTDLAHSWNSQKLAQVPADAIASEWPEDFAADRVVQKFQAAVNQYIPEGSPYLPRAGAAVAAAQQNPNQQDAFAMGRDGALWVYWEPGNGPWTDGTSGRRGPAAITPAHLAPPAAGIATAKQTDNQLDAFVVGNDGAVHVTWEVADGHWSDGTAGQSPPARITPTNLAPPGAGVAASHQTPDQLDAFVAGNDGALHVTWVVGTGIWSDGMPGHAGPARITPTQLAPPGASVAAAPQNANQLDAFVVGNDGAVHVTWVVGTGIWSDGMPGDASPARITPTQLAPPGAGVAAAKQTADQLDAFVVGNDGAVYVTWVVGGGHWSDGMPGDASPARITPTGLAPKGACVTAAQQNDQQLDVFVVGTDGAVHVTWVVGTGHWSDGTQGNPGPARITPTGIAKPGSCVAAAKPWASQLNAFVVGVDGEIWLVWEVNDGHWSDGNPGFPGPASLTQALWMHNWFSWPHIHGSPVYADFAGRRAMLYVWPEKDHLKAFPWLGNRADTGHRVLAVGLDHALALAPPGPPFGMPGGMLAVAIDPTRTDGGVVFASIARVPDQSKGWLRAFDPVTLAELWNNGSDDYRFVKFVPPTIAGGRVFLPTASGQVRVYGKH